ncbi:uncharacterized protein LOC124806618 [Hydra vulgaris]|uniref:uncharacterized protein LOC124806618 n=1 Tax=Hydra vulgaris TaxID=6087 RepID=UPI0032EA3AC8
MFFKILALLLLMQDIEPYGFLSDIYQMEFLNSTTKSSPAISRRSIANQKGIEPLSNLSRGIETDLFIRETKLSKPIFKREITNPKVYKRDAKSYRLFKEIDNNKKKFHRARKN